MLTSFIKVWKESGQSIGFIILVVILTLYGILLQDEMRTDSLFTVLWLVLFFGGATFIGLQGRKYGWKLPKNIKNTH